LPSREKGDEKKERKREKFFSNRVARRRGKGRSGYLALPCAILGEKNGR